MAIDRDVWINRFPIDRFPSWPCPHCNMSVLTLEEDSLFKTETAGSLETMRQEFYDPDSIVNWFQCRLKCARRECGETILVSGHAQLEEVYDQEADDNIGYQEIFSPVFLYPAPDMIRINDLCPEEIKKEIRRAFSLYWCDTGASGNRIRSSVEMLLTEQGIKKTEITKKKKRRYLDLHRRIELYSKKNPEMSDHLMAVKWLGNAGSHPSGLRREVLLDAFEILSNVVDEIYGRRRQTLSQMTKQIIKRKGPRSK
jgi:hypothetical protein